MAQLEKVRKIDRSWTRWFKYRKTKSTLRETDGEEDVTAREDAAKEGQGGGGKEST